jgi:N-acyl-D-amino-acid deacylase
MNDKVIRGGKIIDGTGRDAFVGDIAISDGVITEVSDRPGQIAKGKEELDADGLLVTPGFVDIHTHYDAQATWDPLLTPSIWHGVTTAVMGSCGVGFAPAAPDKHEWLIGLMEGVEDIPGAAMTEGINWQWEHFPEYLDALEKMPRALDIGAQVPHGAVRGYVMGERGAANEDATAEDIKQMQRIVQEAIEAGALGFSTSRTQLHKAIDGRVVPGTYAARDELFAIGEALKAAGSGVFQFAIDHHRVPEEIDTLLELARNIRRPVMFNLSQIDNDPQLWRVGLNGLERAAEQGLPVYAQVAGRAIGIVMSWHLTAHPFATRPTWLQMMHDSREDKIAALRDPAIREKIINEEPLVIGEFETFVTSSWHKMFPTTGGGVNYEPKEEDSIAAIAARTGRRPEEVAYDFLMEDNTDAFLYFPLFNYAENTLEPLHELHQHPRTLMGLSDAGAHCGAVCDGGMPTFMLSHWARDRSRGSGTLPLAHMIKRQTKDTAEAFGMMDRGVLLPGYRADANLIDFDRLNLRKPEVWHDLPAGGRRLVQRADGYVATLAGGQVIVKDDEPTGVLPGKLLRGPQAAPAGSVSKAA